MDLIALVQVTQAALLSLEIEIEKWNITVIDTKAIYSLRYNFKIIETREGLNDVE